MQFQGVFPSQQAALPLGGRCSERSSQQSKMFNFFKRSAPGPAKAMVKPAGHQSPAPRKDVAPPLPEEAVLPEVVEGNESTDWALWEDSVNVLDSQLQGLTPSARIYERDKQTPSELQDLDPFARINKNSA
jgi:hypothetical protein